LARLHIRGPPTKMKILVSNDDGYRAEGIVRLRAALATVADVTVVAPDRNRSGASNSLTLDVPLRVTQSEPGVHFVTGTPTDCVHLAVSGLFDFDFDMAVSGVNDGPNLGDDVLYSGTVAAAIEGRFLGLPTLAVSLCTQPGGARHFETGAQVALRIVTQLLGRTPRSAADPEYQRARPAARRAARHSRHPARVSTPLGARDPGAQSQGGVHVLGRSIRGWCRRGRGHGFSRSGGRLGVRDAAVDRPYPALRARRARPVAGRCTVARFGREIAVPP